ncbi:uncharacterized protein JCM15063_006413 [Sporobolomyces koalae]|uniref:uncharacterized protein n=1 Tax=Sporobolomyces koalae TaxID=500713 RepID=UPI00317E7FBC
MQNSATAKFYIRPHQSFPAQQVIPEALGERPFQTAQCRQYASKDVVFSFAPVSPDSPRRQLWANSRTLRGVSPYFEVLFSSRAFSEAETRTPPLLSFCARKPAINRCAEREHHEGWVVATGTNTELVELDHEDSDIENDLDDEPALPPRVRHLEVTQIAYKTLLSFLYYLETGEVHFSTLSSLSAQNPSSNKSKPPSFPTCSPKSMFALAHPYEHTALRDLPYASIASQLASNNAVTEYFSDLSATYDEIGSLTLQAMLDNWEVVKESTEMLKIQDDVKQGNLEPRKVGLLFTLMVRLRSPANE